MNSVIGSEVCLDVGDGVLGSFPSGPEVRFGVFVIVKKLAPCKNNMWLDLFLQLPCDGSTNVEVWCEKILVLGSNNSQVGV